jgi:hypothetical protein
VFNAIAQGEGVIFFLDGPGGLGKTFVYNVLLASVRRDEHVTIGVASFGITSFLLEGGRTSHLVFKILIAINRDSMCSIHVQSDFVELLWEAKLIIWDEAPTQHRHCVKAIDQTLRDIMQRPDSLLAVKWLFSGVISDNVH